MSWIEQLKKEATQTSERIINERKEESSRTTIMPSRVIHKCFSCKKNIPTGTIGIIVVTTKIYKANVDTPIFFAKYYCDEDCKKGIKEKKEKEIIPEGFELINSE